MSIDYTALTLHALTASPENCLFEVQCEFWNTQSKQYTYLYFGNETALEEATHALVVAANDTDFSAVKLLNYKVYSRRELPPQHYKYLLLLLNKNNAALMYKQAESVNNIVTTFQTLAKKAAVREFRQQVIDSVEHADADTRNAVNAVFKTLSIPAITVDAPAIVLSDSDDKVPEGYVAWDANNKWSGAPHNLVYVWIKGEDKEKLLVAEVVPWFKVLYWKPYISTNSTLPQKGTVCDTTNGRPLVVYYARNGRTQYGFFGLDMHTAVNDIYGVEYNDDIVFCIQHRVTSHTHEEAKKLLGDDAEYIWRTINHDRGKIVARAEVLDCVKRLNTGNSKMLLISLSGEIFTYQTVEDFVRAYNAMPNILDHWIAFNVTYN